MATLLTEVNSVLGVEIGSIETRAVLFDVVEESYQFIAAGSAPSTCASPVFDATVGVIEAIERLQEITGRFLLDLHKRLIIPSHGGVEGVDKLVLPLSCGPDLDAVTFALFNDISLETVRRLARTVPLNVIEEFGINDRRPTQNQMDALLAARPRIVLFAGGSDRGATRSVARMANMIASTLVLLPKSDRPEVLYCGNHAMAKRVQEIIERVAEVHITGNVRPEIESEEIGNASFDLNQLIVSERMRSINGLELMTPLCSDQPILTGTSMQRIIQFLGKQYDPLQGVLGIDLGSTRTTAAFANHETCRLSTLPLGTGIGLEKVLSKVTAAEIEKWLAEPIPQSRIMEYLWQKTLFPNSQPVTAEDLAIELALARQILSMTMDDLAEIGMVNTRSFEPILVGGPTLTHATDPSQVLLTLLDGIQPTGITPLILDKHGILAMLGAAARINPLMPIQVLESSAFINLATVITLESNASPNTAILEARLRTQSGRHHECTIKQGSLVSMPLAFGEPGLLYLKPLKKLGIADTVITEEPVKVRGGVCGLVFDARGRPLRLPLDEALRRQTLQKWATLGREQ